MNLFQSLLGINFPYQLRLQLIFIEVYLAIEVIIMCGLFRREKGYSFNQPPLVNYIQILIQDIELSEADHQEMP